ncbi:MAG: LysR family transcriptional regulator [Lachnospiraceae bacterium]|nr:LysR family transcriptional regulator [Lachnospiraceae bacterium]
MTIIQLQYFNEICKQKNMTKAARALHVSQPSLSNALRSLEEELGVQLFYRVKKRLLLTREGEFFLQESGRILADLDRLYQQMKDLGNKHNLIRIGIPPMIGTLIFPQILIWFKRKYPDIKIEVNEIGSISSRELLMNESLDLAIIVPSR